MIKQPILEIKNLNKQIGKTTIIQDISLNLYPGEVFGFLGPNGAGKTTTIRMIVGLMSITKGDVLINGYSIQKNFEKAIGHVGGIIENPEMYKFLTGYENLLHYARMIPNIKKNKINEVIELVGLDKRIHEKVKTYSLGMRQRLGLAQALLHSPKILILDEPTNGLDPAGIREIRSYIRKIAKEDNISVFVSSHLLSEMQLMCDRIGIVHHGKLISVNTVEEMTDSKEQVSVQFLVNPIEDAYHLVTKNYPETKVQMRDQKIHMMIKQKQIAQYTRLFVNNGLDVSGINSEKISLEEKFIEITGGDNND